jgi:cell division protein ZapA (FtsZ GTPase activity inhibitor)
MSLIRVAKIEMMSTVNGKEFSVGYYYERADNLQAIGGMVDAHLDDSDGDVLCISVEEMDEDKFNALPEFCGW